MWVLKVASMGIFLAWEAPLDVKRLQMLVEATGVGKPVTVKAGTAFVK